MNNIPPDSTSYTWSQFTAAVLALLPTDASRLGPVQDALPRWIRERVIDIEEYIPGYQKNHETLFSGADFAGEGYASRAAIPPQGRIVDAYLITYDCQGWQRQPGNQRRCLRSGALRTVAWEARMDLVEGRDRWGGGPVLSINRQAHNFYLYPAITDRQQLSVFWEGKRINFNPDELTPFDEPMTQVVADGVKARIELHINRDIGMANEFDALFAKGRSRLYIEMHEKRNPKA